MPWGTVLGFAALVGITTGCRQSLGLFVRPLAATGIGIADVSLVLAVGQFCWGASQPVFGLLADRIGTFRVVAIGAVLLAAGLALTPWMHSTAGLFVSLGLLSAIGAGAGSFAILVGAAAQRVAAPLRAMASSYVSTGASLGQFVFAPLTQAIMAFAGWEAAIEVLAVAAFATLALGAAATRGVSADASAAPAPRVPILDQLRPAFAERGYWCLHVGFFTCGFHIGFLVTHLPGEVSVCGLPAASAGVALGVIGIANVGGTLAFGRLARFYRLKSLLICLYLSRVAAIGAYLLLPKTLVTLYFFSMILGSTWLATLPLTAGVVGKLFGARHLSTLFGLTVMSHQLGSFFGAWLGGLAVARSGNYLSIWELDMALAALAAFVHLPIREQRPNPSFSRTAA
jgi:predicted MFS family arabinose efflux permease